MYPPLADASQCTTIRPMPVVIPNVVADAPEFGQGEMDTKPKPAASVTSTSAMASATNAPEIIAGQLTAEFDDSQVTAPIDVGGRSMSGPAVVSISVPDQGENDNDRDW